MQGAYYQLYDLLSGYLYGPDAVLTGDMELTLTMISTAGALFVVAMPFMLVWRFIKLFA